jgi:hypothetical protein
MTKLLPTFALWLLSAGVIGCDDVDLDGSELADEPTFRAGEVKCPKCQFNSAHVGGSPVSHLDLSGEPNEFGVAVRHLRDPDGDLYDLGVADEEFAAYHKDELVAVGDDLIGWSIVLEVNRVEQRIQITGRELLPSWAKNRPPISIYALEVPGADSVQNICLNQAPGVAALTLLHGETYDPERKQIAEVGPQWLTLACVGEAMYKVKRMDYGPNGRQGPNGGLTTPAQRTAALKMVTADYCGTGKSFTEDNTQLLFNNNTRTVQLGDMRQLVHLEAYWDEHGARCITKPRLAPLDKVLGACSLPKCESYHNATPYEFKSVAPTNQYHMFDGIFWTPTCQHSGCK